MDSTTLSRLRHEIDALDEQILQLIERRTKVSRQVGVARRAAGGPRIVHQRELEIFARYVGKFGREGNGIAEMLLRLGRGTPGKPVITQHSPQTAAEP